MLFVDSLDEARAASDTGIDLLSIIDTLWTAQMREAAGDCFVQVGLPYGQLVTLEDSQRAAHQAIQLGAVCVYCASSFVTIKALADDGIPVVSHVGLIPSRATWTGGFKAVGKTAQSAVSVFGNVKVLEDTGAYGAELDVVPDRVAAEIARRTSLVLPGMGLARMLMRSISSLKMCSAYTRGHKPRHAKTYRNCRVEYDRLQRERVAAFQELRADVYRGVYPAIEHSVGIEDAEFHAFLCRLPSITAS